MCLPWDNCFSHVSVEPDLNLNNDFLIYSSLWLCFNSHHFPISSILSPSLFRVNMKLPTKLLERILLCRLFSTCISLSLIYFYLCYLFGICYWMFSKDLLFALLQKTTSFKSSHEELNFCEINLTDRRRQATTTVHNPHPLPLATTLSEHSQV